MVNFLSDVENYFGSILSLVSIQLIWIITAFSEVPNDEKFKLVVGFIIISICGAIMTILICCKDKMNGPNKEIYLVIIFFMASLISVQLV